MKELYSGGTTREEALLYVQSNHHSEAVPTCLQSLRDLVNQLEIK